MMKIRKLFSIVVPVSVAMLATTACSDYDNGFTEKEIEYQRNFESVFGKADPNQTWSTVNRSKLTTRVNMPGNGDYTLKVYTANPRGQVADCYLLGEWTVGSKSETEHVFDVPAHLKSVWVAVVNADGGRYVQEAEMKDDCTVSAAFDLNAVGGTRAVSGVSVAISDAPAVEFPLSDYFTEDGKGFLDIYKESAYIGDGINYDEGLCTDFEFVSNGDPIVLTAFYACTAGGDAIKAIIYYPEEGEKLIDYKNDESRTIDIVPSIQGTQEFSAFEYKSITKDGYDVYSEEWKFYTQGSYEAIKNDYDLIGTSFKKWVDGALVSDPDHSVTGSTVVGRGHSYTVTGVPAGAHVVFFLQAGTSDRAFTRSALNKEVEYRDLDNKQGHAMYAGLIPSQIEGQYVIGFEDALLNSYIPDGDYDINDAVFVISGGVVPEDHEDEIETAVSYLIAYEDLGATCDFDFNDIVLKVTHVAGRSTASATVLAAGGTLPVKLTYGDETYCEDVHGDAFGVSTSTVVNAMPGQHSAYASKTYTISGIDDDSFALKKFGIAVDQDENGSYETTIHAPQYYLTAMGASPVRVGDEESPRIPYAILIGYDNWDWPDENVSIASDEFIEWVKDASKCTWYTTADRNPNNVWGGPVSTVDMSVGQELTVSNDQTFTYRPGEAQERKYKHAVKISFAGVTASEGATATLKVQYSAAQKTTIYLDYADGKQIYEDASGTQAITVSYTLSAAALAKILAPENEADRYIWIVALNDPDIDVEKAVLEINAGGGSTGGGGEDYGTAYGTDDDKTALKSESGQILTFVTTDYVQVYIANDSWQAPTIECITTENIFNDNSGTIKFGTNTTGSRAGTYQIKLTNIPSGTKITYQIGSDAVKTLYYKPL